MYIPDYLDNWDAYDREREESLEQLPICSCCGERIMDDFCYVIDGDFICDSCMAENRRSVESIMGR